MDVEKEEQFIEVKPGLGLRENRSRDALHIFLLYLYGIPDLRVKMEHG